MKSFASLQVHALAASDPAHQPVCQRTEELLQQLHLFANTQVARRSAQVSTCVMHIDEEPHSTGSMHCGKVCDCLAANWHTGSKHAIMVLGQEFSAVMLIINLLAMHFLHRAWHLGARCHWAYKQYCSSIVQQAADSSSLLH